MGGANEGVALAHGVAQLGCHAKVCHLHFARLCQQDVAALDVPVNLQQAALVLLGEIQQDNKSHKQLRGRQPVLILLFSVCFCTYKEASEPGYQAERLLLMSSAMRQVSNTIALMSIFGLKIAGINNNLFAIFPPQVCEKL